jgi:hypothetical protein
MNLNWSDSSSSSFDRTEESRWAYEEGEDGYPGLGGFPRPRSPQFTSISPRSFPVVGVILWILTLWPREPTWIDMGVCLIENKKRQSWGTKKCRAKTRPVSQLHQMSRKGWWFYSAEFRRRGSGGKVSRSRIVENTNRIHRRRIWTTERKNPWGRENLVWIPGVNERCLETRVEIEGNGSDDFWETLELDCK